MSPGRWTRRCTAVLVAASLAASLAGPAQAGYQGTVASNESAFEPPCLTFDDPYPEKMQKAAATAFAALGYETRSYIGAAFTRAAYLARTANDWGTYVHSHGDHYWHAADGRRYAGLPRGLRRLQPGGRLLEGHRAQAAGRQADLVVMSMCHVGEARLDDARRVRDREAAVRRGHAGAARSSSSGTSARPGTTTSGRSRSRSGTPSGPATGPARRSTSRRPRSSPIRSRRTGGAPTTTRAGRAPSPPAATGACEVNAMPVFRSLLRRARRLAPIALAAARSPFSPVDPAGPRPGGAVDRYRAGEAATVRSGRAGGRRRRDPRARPRARPRPRRAGRHRDPG